MATRTKVLRAATAALAASLFLAGCTSSSGTDLTDSTAAGSSSIPARASTPPLSSTKLPPSAPPVTSSSATTTAAPTSTPWPPELTPDQVTQAQAALATYTAYWKVIDEAIADPGQDWTPQLTTVATDPELDLAMQDFATTAAKGQRATGVTGVEPVVTKVDPGLITITACIDKTATDFLDANGKSIKAPNAPGSYLRHVSTVQVGQFGAGQWLVTNTSDDWSTTC